MLGNLGLHTADRAEFILHVTILLAVEEMQVLRSPRDSSEHPCRTAETTSSLESQLAFSDGDTTGGCMTEDDSNGGYGGVC